MNYIIKRFMSSRPEQKYLRKFLIDNFNTSCVICKKKLPPYLLECSHIKPRSLLCDNQLKDTNNVLFLCKYCHAMYDNGDIGINDYNIEFSNYILDFEDLHLDEIKYFENDNENNKIYLKYHYNNIFKK